AQLVGEVGSQGRSQLLVEQARLLLEQMAARARQATARRAASLALPDLGLAARPPRPPPREQQQPDVREQGSGHQDEEGRGAVEARALIQELAFRELDVADVGSKDGDVGARREVLE